MGILTGVGEDWSAARWAFASLMELAQTRATNGRVAEVFKQASAYDGLHVALLEPDLVDPVLDTLLGCASDVAGGTAFLVTEVGERFDSATDEQLRDAARRLADILRGPSGSGS